MDMLESVPHINISVYAESMADKVALIGTDEDEIFKGLNNYFRELSEKQIRIVKGKQLVTKKAMATKRIIKKHNIDFGGSLSDAETIRQAGNSFYKYKRELQTKEEE